MPRIRWTPEEDERLLDLIAAGKSWTLISGMLKRSMKSVKLHAKTLRLVGVKNNGLSEMRATRLQELEEMAAKLLETARKLPSEQDRHNALQEIERFRARITALQRLDLQSPQPYDLVTRPCTIHAGRFRWDIRENGRPIQSSVESFATEQEAHADGRHELEKVIQVSRL